MDRRKFFSIAGTFTGGGLIIPQFLHHLNARPLRVSTQERLIFIQLNGGNDGLNTFVPYNDPLYSHFRPNIAFAKNEVINHHSGMAFHPSLKGLAEIQQKGDLSIVQNVGYPKPNRSHFRSQEIWQTGSGSTQYFNEGWLGRFLDLQCTDHEPIAGINLDRTDTLALRGIQPNAMTVKDPNRFRVRAMQENNNTGSSNAQLDFVRRVANSIQMGSQEIQKALEQSNSDVNFPRTGLGRKLEWIARLIKGGLKSKIYYTSLNGFDTHDNQIPFT